MRVYSGKLEAGSYALNSTKGERERIGRLLQMHANHREDISFGERGRHRGSHRPESDIYRRHALRSRCAGRPRIDHIPGAGHLGLDRAEDARRPGQDGRRAGPTGGRGSRPSALRTNEETGQTVIEGMGELHLEVIVDRLMREFRVDANVGRPQVAYKETITIPVKAEGRHIRQSGGKGQYGHVVVEFEPQERGEGYEFEDKIVGGSIPREYIPSVDAGYPRGAVDRWRGGLPARRSQGDGWSMDRSTRSTRRKWRSRSPDRWRSRKRCGAVAIVILEPIMEVEVTTPDEFMGDVIGDLNSRRGHIQGMEMRAGAQVVKAFVPLAAMFGYATDLRSATQGRATYSMQFDHYAPLPTAIAQEMIAKARRD